MGNYNFKKDLHESHPSVLRVIELLTKQGCTNIRYNHDYKYDLIYLTREGKEETIEVKHDHQYGKTGNVAIEYRSRKKPSCLSTSKADKWCYVLNQIYWCDLGELRAYLTQHWDRYSRVKGGDEGTSDLALLKMDYFLDVFRPMGD